jgi:hypothetical protein
MAAARQSGKMAFRLGWRELPVVRQWRRIVMGELLQCLLAAIGHRDPGKGFDMPQKTVIELLTMQCEFQQRGWVLGVACGQHARRRPGGFPHGLAALQYDDIRPTPPQFERTCQPDHSRTRNDDVGSPHVTIVARSAPGNVPPKLVVWQQSPQILCGCGN